MNLYKIMKVAVPSIIMMVFMSLYTIVDGLFVSRLVGSDALSAINIVYPAWGLLFAVGIMLATGGSAVVAKKLGEGKKQEAREIFSLIVYSAIIFSLFLTCIVLIFNKEICFLLGSDEMILHHCMTYLGIIASFFVCCMLQSLFQVFLVTANQPNLGLVLTLGAGIINMVLDYVFISVCQIGIAGAALATGLGQSLPAIVGILFFLRKKQDLYLCKTHFYGKEFMQTCINGSSEMVTNISASITTLLFNLILMKLAGIDGVSSITIILYTQFTFLAVFMGYSMGIAPLVSFNLGAKKYKNIQYIMKVSIFFTLITSVMMCAICYYGAEIMTALFLDVHTKAYSYTKHGFELFSLSYLFCGINVVLSGMFTALNDGKHSALISFLRTLVFAVGCLLLMPYWLGIDGVYLALPCAELLTAVVSIYLINDLKKKYF